MGVPRVRDMDSVIPEIEGSPEDDATDRSDVPQPAIYREKLDTDHIDPDAAKVVRRLSRHGHVAYLVGGSVRDLLLGRQPKDFDVATSARPEEVRRLFRNCRIIGRRFRLAHILFGRGKVIETATFRRDPGQGVDVVEREIPDEHWDGDEGEPIRLSPARKDASTDQDLLIKHDNVFGEPHEDAIRRDFTINGLFYDVEADEVIDYVGGVPDLRSRLVRTIGDPDVRIREDPIRILRAIKFSARLDLGIDPELYDAMVEHRDDLQRSARPRVLEEIFRLLRGGAAQRSIYLAWDTGVLSVLLPELQAFLDDDAPEAERMWALLSQVDRRHKRGRLPSDPVLFAALLLGPIEEWLDDARDPSKAFEEFFTPVVERLAVPRRLKDRVRSIVIAQRRLQAEKLGSLPRRDFFPEAATLLTLCREAAGEPVPDWALDPDSAQAGPEGGRGRRRRRRRRRRRGG